MKPKIMVLVVSSDTYPSKRNKKIIQKTWVQNCPNNINVFFYKSGLETFINKNNEIILKVGKSTRDISKKNLLAFEYVLKNFEFEYLFRTTTTSYVNLKKLNDLVVDKFTDFKELYCGKIMKTYDLEKNKQTFVSGAGILFSKSTIQNIVNNKEKIDLELWDDVGIGKLLNELEINPVEGSRYDIKGNIFNLNVDLNQYHYRCRIDNHYGYPRFLEYYVIKYLDKMINEIKISKFTNFLFKYLFETSKIFYIQYPIWKLYSIIKKLIKFILPKKIFKILKQKLNNLNTKFNLKYFKY